VLGVATSGLLLATDGLLLATDGLLLATDGLLLATRGLLLATDGLLLATNGLLLATSVLLLATDSLLLETDGLLLATNGLLLATDGLLLATNDLLLATSALLLAMVVALLVAARVWRGTVAGRVRAAAECGLSIASGGSRGTKWPAGGSAKVTRLGPGARLYPQELATFRAQSVRVRWCLSTFLTCPDTSTLQAVVLAVLLRLH
jgi:hypothetical protein